MKKWYYFLGVLFCCMFCTLPVRADVINEPPDSFYERHASDCEYVNRLFTANGPDGVVIVYKSPESAKELETWENGSFAWISYTYEDSGGILWGLNDYSGWVPMAYMEVVYDSISFAEEYEADIMEQEGDLDGQYLNGDIYLWKYPGYTEGTLMEAEMLNNPPHYNRIYVDEEGRSWGNIGYYYGMRNMWVCIDHPAEDFAQLYPDGAPKVEKTKPDENVQLTEKGTRIAPKPDHGIVIFVAAIVVLVMIITSLLLVALKRMGRRIYAHGHPKENCQQS